MRHRILCLALIALLVAPAAGWAKGAVIDPNGQSATDQGVTTESDKGAEIDPHGLTAPGASLWQLLAGWLARFDLVL